MAERQALFDAILVGGVNEFRAPQTAAALGTLGLAEVTATGLTPQDLAASGDLEPLGHRLLRFDTFGTSHKFSFLAKERAI